MFGFTGKQKSVLHLTWVAFFLTFVAWFNMAPFHTAMMKFAGLSLDQIHVLMIANVALTIPARILIGVLVDSYGPKKYFPAYSCLPAACVFILPWPRILPGF